MNLIVGKVAVASVKLRFEFMACLEERASAVSGGKLLASCERKSFWCEAALTSLIYIAPTGSGLGRL